MESLELTITSASGLKDANTIGTMDPYVIVTLSTDPKSRQRTDLAMYGGVNPKWRRKTMKFAVNKDLCKKQNVKLVFQIMAEKVFGDQEVGEVVLLVSELFGQIGQMDEKPLSCAVSTPSGRIKGKLFFSYKFVKNATSSKSVSEPNVASVYAPPMTIESGTSRQETDLYPPPTPYPEPQKVVAAPNALTSPSPQLPQPAEYNYPPIQQGYPPLQQQWYAPPPPHYQQLPVGYYQYPPPPPQQEYIPPPQKGYAPQSPGYAYAPGNQVQVKEVGKKPKPNKAGWLAGAAALAGTMLLGVDVGSSSLGGTANAGGYLYDYNSVLSGHYDSIGSAIG